MSDPAEPFETWLLRRAAEAVEAGEVSADLLAEIHSQIAETRGRSPDERHPLALMELAERVQLPVDRLTELLANLEGQPGVTREYEGDSSTHAYAGRQSRITIEDFPKL